MIINFKFWYDYIKKHVYRTTSLLIFILIIVIFFFSSHIKRGGYELFVEFSNAYGLKEGTRVNFRGVKVGYVKYLNIQLNTVVVLLYINSLNILIPKNSLVEANQIGLFNDVVIDITPLESVSCSSAKSFNALSKNCLQSPFICSNFYLKGHRGLSYDDLVRATTRISQRFDDPRFFSVFYLLLQNSLSISDEMLFLVNHASYLLYLFVELIKLFLFKY